VVFPLYHLWNEAVLGSHGDISWSSRVMYDQPGQEAQSQGMVAIRSADGVDFGPRPTYSLSLEESQDIFRIQDTQFLTAASRQAV
jgi:hypothetical protein